MYFSLFAKYLSLLEKSTAVCVKEKARNGPCPEILNTN